MELLSQELYERRPSQHFIYKNKTVSYLETETADFKHEQFIPIFLFSSIMA